VAISDSLLTSVLVTALLAAVSAILTRRRTALPDRVQVVLEGIVSACENAVRDVIPTAYREVTPFIMSLWLFLATANLISLIPALDSPTRDPSVTSAPAVLVFFSVHWFGVRQQALAGAGAVDPAVSQGGWLDPAATGRGLGDRAADHGLLGCRSRWSPARPDQGAEVWSGSCIE
jgi:hypothetical protein